MNLAKHLNRLRTIHRYIKNETTGRPNEFAKKLNIGKSSLFSLLEEMKTKGFPIAFSRKINSYRYTGLCELEINFSVILTTENGKKEIFDTKS